jgi:hypothetical protein
LEAAALCVFVRVVRAAGTCGSSGGVEFVLPASYKNPCIACCNYGVGRRNNVVSSGLPCEHWYELVLSKLKRIRLGALTAAFASIGKILCLHSIVTLCLFVRERKRKVLPRCYTNKWY